jgi:hypothetical protein
MRWRVGRRHGSMDSKRLWIIWRTRTFGYLTLRIMFQIGQILMNILLQEYRNLSQLLTTIITRTPKSDLICYNKFRRNMPT